MTSERWVWRAIWLGLAVRVAIAVWNAFVGPSFGAEVDAQTFHRYAIQVSRHVQPPEGHLAVYSYAHALGLLYRITGESVLIGSLLSCAAWLASAWSLRAMMILLDAHRTVQFAGLLIFASLPSSVLWTSVTLREPYQLLCANLALLAALRILIARDHRCWLLLPAAIVLGTYLHVAIAVFAVVVAAMTLLVELWRPLRPAARLALVAAVSMAVVAGTLVLFRAFMYDFTNGPQAALEEFLVRGMYPARSNYRETSAVGGMLGVMIFVPMALFQYLFEPMPWHINAPIDFGYVVENLVRAALIGAMLLSIVRLRGAARLHVVMIALSYFCLELLWSLGTLNWGTSARHHLPASGALIAGATAYSRRGSLAEWVTEWTPERLRA